MTEEQYLSLCESCDSILVAEDSTFERMAIPFLHVLREHPVFLKQYEGIFLPSLPIHVKFFNCCRRALLDHARMIRAIWHYFKFSNKKWCGDLPSGSPVDFVFVSHLLNLSQLSGEDDFYFGKVPSELISKGKSVALVLINQNGIPTDDIELYLEESKISRIVISKVLSPRDEFHIKRRAVFEAKKLKNAAHSEASALRKLILRKASIEATSPGTMASLRIAKLVGEVVSHCRAQTIVTTYEGHSWERLVYAAARKSNPDISCIGYLHAALFRLQHAAKRSLGSQFDPDKIYCAGSVGLGQLQRNGYLPKDQLGILGSNRSVSTLTSNGIATCLVLPEGIVEECELLFEFSFSCAQAHPEIHFIWRLHPILTFDKLVRRIKVLKHLPSNIEISTKPFEEDILRCSLALYRGSTAAIIVAARGVVPIYVERTGELTIDPLFEISEMHPSVSSVKDFSNAIGWEKWTEDAKKYCKSFYTPFNSEVLTATN